jgi:hypothetical protein
MKEIDRPASAQVTATPRPVTAPRQVRRPILHELREAPAGGAQRGLRLQAATVKRPVSQETPVTRSSVVAVSPLHGLALTPTGASVFGAPDVDAGGAVCVCSEDDPHPESAKRIAAVPISVAVVPIRADFSRGAIDGSPPI